MIDTAELSNASVMARTSTETPHETVQRQDPLMSDEDLRVLEIIFYSTLGGLVGVVGSAVNVINIVVFVKQGFRDSVSISLCALAVSDLGFLLAMIWISVGSNTLIQHSDIGIDIANINNLTGGLIESCFVRITNLVTAYTTFERCICVAMPLKVKNIITPKRTLIIIVVMYIFIFSTNLPTFSYVYLAKLFNPKINTTLIGLMYSSNDFETISSSFNAFLQLSTFIIVILCTVVLVLKLLVNSEWRHKAISGSDVSDSISTRDKRVMKMVTFISAVFIACYIPSTINLLLIVGLAPEYGVTGSYENSYLASWAIIGVLEGINSSVTILVYYNMSSKFRETLTCIIFKPKKSY